MKEIIIDGEKYVLASPPIGGRWVIVGNGPWGLWFGRVIASDEEIVATKSARLYDARNIRYWYGRNGGITSLAAHGLCGPKAAQSKIGAPIKSTLLLDVKAVHDCSAECVATFAAHEVK
ncbi:MAG: hypothetical protein V1755_14145 [Chloroflexota bacterium]